MRRGLLQVADDASVRALVVDVRLLEVAREEVADDPQRQLGLLVDELRRLRSLLLGLDRAPEPLQEDEVALDVLLGRALGGGADDDAALFHVKALEDVLQPVALVVVEPARDAEALSLRDEDDEPARQRDLRRQPRALRLHRILDGLDEDRLAARDQVLDLAPVALLELRADDLVDVEETVLLEADLDERRLHAGQDVVDAAEVDVAGDRAALRPLEVDLGDLAVLEDGDVALADVDGDDQLALRGGKRGAALRLAAPAGRRLVAAALLSLRELAPLWLLRLLRLGLLLPLRRGRAGGGTGLLAPAPATAAAAALRLARIGRFRAGRVGGRFGQLGLGLRLELGYVRTLVVGRLFLPETEPRQVRTPSWERAAATSGEVRARSLSMKRLGMAYGRRVATVPPGVRPSPDLRSGQLTTGR